MRDDDKLSETLRKAYGQLPQTIEPTPFLWQRTRAALRNHGLLRPRRRSWITAGLVAAGLVGFLAGWVAGRVERSGVQVATTSASDPFVAATRVQETGTSYTLALEGLVRSLEEAHPADVELGQQVTLAAARAQSRVLQQLVSTGLDTEGLAPPSSSSTKPSPVIWF